MLALWVIVHHLLGKGMMLNPVVPMLSHSAVTLIGGGYLAVQTFFILSGFVLARSYCAAQWNGSSLTRYFSARFARIYPTYALSLGIVSYFAALYLRQPSISSITKLRMLSDYAFVLQGWRNGGGPGWNTPAWSLSCELFFYLLLPAVLPLIWRAGSRRLIVIVLASLIAPAVLVRLGMPSYWKPILHFPDFIMGIAAARVFTTLEQRGIDRSSAPWLYIPAIVFGAALIASPHAFAGTYFDLNTALRPLNAIALIGLAMGGGVVARLLSMSWVEYLGQASYSMYILHIPLLWWYGNGGFKRFHLPWAPAAIVYLAIVIAASVLSYEYVEKPANRWIREWIEGRLEPRGQLRAAA